MSTCNFAIAVEGVGWRSPDYWPMLVMQSIFGNWDRSLGASPLLSSKLSHIISSNNLANSFMSFSTSYSDTGLWGIYAVSENVMNLDDLTHFIMKEWQRMSINPTTAEVERAKSQLKASLLLGLDGTTAIAEDIGRQTITTGKRFTPKEIERYVNAVGVEDIKRVAQAYLWDKGECNTSEVALAGVLRKRGASWDLLSNRASKRPPPSPNLSTSTTDALQTSRSLLSDASKGFWITRVLARTCRRSLTKRRSEESASRHLKCIHDRVTTKWPIPIGRSADPVPDSRYPMGRRVCTPRNCRCVHSPTEDACQQHGDSRQSC
jgi:hypothetical protein